LGDYFQKGYLYYARTKAERQRTRQLHAQYFEQLAYAITAAGADLRGAQRDRALQQVLRAITAVVRVFHGDGALGIRSNVMRGFACAQDESIRKKFQFVDSETRNCDECLVLVTYDDGRHDDLVLPVANESEALLPGAPTAFRKRVPEIIQDTKKIDFSPKLTSKTRAAEKKYFAEQGFRSFASLCIFAEGEVLGVLNVESDFVNVFGESPEQQKRLTNYLLPFCSALGILLK
jgi:hypothetical protein